MPTITLNIPEQSAMNMPLLKDRLGRYAQYLVKTLDKGKHGTAPVKRTTGHLSSLYGILDLPEEASFESLRSRAMKGKFGL